MSSKHPHLIFILVSFMNFKTKLASLSVSGLLVMAIALSSAAQVDPARDPVRDAARERLETNKQKLDEQRSIVDERKADVKAEREAVRENVQQRKENIQDRREEVRARLTEKRKETIRRHFDRMMKRFEAALERQQKLAERIQSRIDKAKERGRNTAKAQAALDKALNLWNEAKTSLAEVKGKIEGVIAADNPREAFKEVQSLVAQTRDKIKAVHAALIESVRALKGIGEGSAERSGAPNVSPEAVSTPAQ